MDLTPLLKTSDRHLDTVDDYERGEDIEEIRRKFKDGLRVDDSNRTVVWAGSSVGLMSQIMSAKVCKKSISIHRPSIDLSSSNLGHCE